MNKILLARIDTRLSHGKVVSCWTKYLKADTVVIANDRVCNDYFEQALMKLTIPKDIEAVFLSPIKVKDYLIENEDKKIFLIVEKTQDLYRIYKDNLLIDKVNIGIIHLSKGKKLLTEEVAVDDNDLSIFSELVDNGIEVFIQLSPFTQKRNLNDFFEKPAEL